MIELSRQTGDQLRVGEPVSFAFRVCVRNDALVEAIELRSSLGHSATSRYEAPDRPRKTVDLVLPGLVADKPGRQEVTVRVTLSTSSGAATYVGRFEVVVRPPRADGPTDVSVPPGQNIVEDFEGMIGPADEDGDAGAAAADRWEPIALVVDTGEAAQADLIRLCPACPVPPDVARLLSKSREHCWPFDLPATDSAEVLKLEGDRRVFHLVPGGRLYIGRDHGRSHVVPPFRPNDWKFKRIGDQHICFDIKKQWRPFGRFSVSEYFARQRWCTALNRSPQGSTVGGAPLARDEEQLVRDGDLVELAGVLRLEARLFADGSGITALRLDPIDGPGQHHYVLIPVYATLGSAPENTIVLRAAGVPAFAAAVFVVSGSDGGRPAQFRVEVLAPDANATLNGHPLPPGQAADLPRGSELLIGPARLRAT